MSTAKITRSEINGKAATNGQTAAENLVSLRAAAWAAVAKVAAEQSNRDDIEGGSTFRLSFTVAGEINGRRFSESYGAEMSVGFDSERASSVGPNQDHLLAYVLSKLNTATREKLLRETADEFASAGGELPAVDENDIKRAAEFRKALRAKVTQPVRGSVRVNSQPIDLRI